VADGVNTAVLARLVQRKAREYPNLREAAKAASLSPSTLSRVQRGNHSPDREVLIALARWLQVPLEKLLTETVAVDRPRDEQSTMQKVEVHLRADPQLSAETADRLMQVYRAVYEEFLGAQRRRRDES
jgi:transcriptional regulator with XRE-family HTH domain